MGEVECFHAAQLRVFQALISRVVGLTEGPGEVAQGLGRWVKQREVKKSKGKGNVSTDTGLSLVAGKSGIQQGMCWEWRTCCADAAARGTRREVGIWGANHGAREENRSKISQRSESREKYLL